jgi:glycosyltransferase involved in cell wall biosynthesis
MISVAIATFNGAKFAEPQLQSILDQSTLPDEIVISDDCSEDETFAILQRFKKGSRVPIIISRNTTRLGYVKNFEKAVWACSGTHIFLADQDNIWFSNKIERQLNADPRALLIHSDAVLIDEGGAILSASYSRAHKRNPNDCSFGRVLCNNPVSGCTAMIRRELLANLHGFPDWLPHDQWMAMIAADKGRLTYIPECLIAFRQHESNTLGAGTRARKRRIQLSSFGKGRGDHEAKSVLLGRTAEFAEGILSRRSCRVIADISRYHYVLGKRGHALQAARLYARYSKYIDFGEAWGIRALKCLATPFRDP